MKPNLYHLAQERMIILIDHAITNARSDPVLSQRQADTARRISTRHKVPMPFHLKMVFCKRCKLFMAPGIGSRIRIGRSPIKAIRISCLTCGHTYRKIISPKR